MDVERPTPSDILADAKRTTRWYHLIPNISWVLVLLTAVRHLSNPTLIGTPRLLWALAPLPLMVWAFWAWGAQERLQDEMARALNGRAAMLAMRLTLFWLFGLVLLGAAVGLPIRIPAPFGLPDDSFGWFEAAFVPLFFTAFAGIRETNKLLPKK